MSIYATLWILKFPALGDSYFGCEWETVIAQGVPGHIGTPTPGHGYEAGDPYSSFLPPAFAISDDDDAATPLRAVVIVRERTEKIGQEYIGPARRPVRSRVCGSVIRSASRPNLRCSSRSQAAPHRGDDRARWEDGVDLRIIGLTSCYEIRLTLPMTPRLVTIVP